MRTDYFRATVAICIAFAGLTARGEEVPAESGSALTANAGFASQYVFRGLTQTNGKPAIQAGADYARSSGIYLGTWLSNISWYGDQNAGTVSSPVALSSPGPLGPPYAANKTNSARLEWDLYGGYKHQFSERWSYDLGAIRYLYPGHFDNTGAYRKPDTTELYGAIGVGWLAIKYSKAISRYSFGTNESRGAGYLDFSANFPILDSGVNLLLHAGRQTYPDRPNSGYFGNSGGNNSLYSYRDYKFGLTKEWEKFSFGAAWTHANTRATAPDGQTTAYLNAFGKNIGGSRLALTITKTF